MSKQKQKETPAKDTAAYYRLHTQAVDDLVTADKSNAPKYSEAELRKYRSGSKLKLADWMKMVFIKFWFPGAVCYFFLWGLSPVIGNLLDLLFITGLALGVVTDLLTNNMIRYFAKVPGGNDWWMMYPNKKYISLIQNIFHSGVVLFLVYTLYNMLNVGLNLLLGAPADNVSLGVEPILFGLFYVGFDMLLIAAKHLLQDIVKRAKESARRS